jgi:hypothetical protein
MYQQEMPVLKMPRAFFLLLLFWSSFVVAPAASSSEQCFTGIWHGTIGKLGVTMQLDDDPGELGGLTGSYYYGRSLNELVLLPIVGHAGRWKEHDMAGTVTGLLSMTCRAGRLEGQWSRPDGSEKKTIVAVSGSSFRARQFEKLPIQVNRTVILDRQRRYQLISVKGIPGVQGVRVLGNKSELRRLNGELSTLFKQRLENLLDCQGFGRIKHADTWRQFVENSASSILAYGSHFVVVEEVAESACGGPHGNSIITAWTWNLQTGAREDVSKWVREGWAPPPYPSADLDDETDENEKADIDTSDTDSLVADALNRYIQTHSREEGEECRDAVTLPFDDEHVWAERSGIVVRPEARSYMERLCAITFTIPYELIWPYLTNDGKHHANAMRQSLP